MGISIERHGIVNCNELIDLLIADMLSGGFTQVFPVGAYDPATHKGATLEAGPGVDPLSATQPWRIRLEALSDLQIKVNVAHPFQLPDTGGVVPLAGMYPVESGVIGRGAIGNGASGTGPIHFIHRDIDEYGITSGNQASYPMSYRLTTCAHGFALFIWNEATDSVGNSFSWLAVQRSVDNATGAPYVTGKSPVYAVFSHPKLGIRKFVVRESDVHKPTISVPATANTEDSRAIINEEAQVAITEDNKYVVTMPNGLNTPRYSYTQELDVVAITSADVVSQWAEVPLTQYGESQPRVYKAMCANGANNTGMRVLMLMSGPSTTPQQP